MSDPNARVAHLPEGVRSPRSQRRALLKSPPVASARCDALRLPSYETRRISSAKEVCKTAGATATLLRAPAIRTQCARLSVPGEGLASGMIRHVLKRLVLGFISPAANWNPNKYQEVLEAALLAMASHITPWAGVSCVRDTGRVRPAQRSGWRGGSQPPIRSLIEPTKRPSVQPWCS